MKKNRMKSIFIVMILCLFALTSACSKAEKSNDPTNNANTSANTDTPKKAITLNYMITTENYSDRLKAFIANYEKMSGNKVEVQLYPATEFDNILKVKMMSNEGPDLFTTDDIAMSQFAVPKDWFEDLSNREWVARLSKGGKSVISWIDGKITGLPVINPGGFGIMYNKDIFAKLGISVPKTFKEFLEISDKIKKAGIIPLNIQLANGSEFGTTHLMHQLFVNAELNQKDNQKQFFQDINEHKIKIQDVPEYEQALNQMVELKQKGYINEDFISNTFEMSQDKFGKGLVAMHPCGDFILEPLLSKYPDTKVGFFSMPFGDTPGAISLYAGVGMSVNSSAKNKEEALKFIDYFASKEQQDLYMKKSPGTNVFADVSGEQNMISKDLQQYMDNGRSSVGMFGKFEAWPEMDARKEMQGVMLGSVTPKQFLVDMDKKAEITAKGKKLPGW
jgi:raffinose/stachyose/melibiose transport system substrate-binding protein